MREALQTANRLRSERIYTGTIQYWEGLLDEANRFLGAAGSEEETARGLVVALEAIVAARRLAAGRPERSLLLS